MSCPQFETPLADVTLKLGEPASLQCRATGLPLTQTTWLKDGQEVSLRSRGSFCGMLFSIFVLQRMSNSKESSLSQHQSILPSPCMHSTTHEPSAKHSRQLQMIPYQFT